MGVNPLEQIGFGHIGATFWTWMFANKIYAALMTFFLANFIENTLISTGAFEIYFNDVPVWSKLQTGNARAHAKYLVMLLGWFKICFLFDDNIGRVPNPPELLQIIDNNLKLMRSEDDLGL